MTQEEKQLLINDICARIPYGVKAEASGWDEENDKEVLVPVTVYSVNSDGYVYFCGNEYDITYCRIEACHPFLRPVSSMTPQEWCDLCDCKLEDDKAAIIVNGRRFVSHINEENFLNSRHFDYFGLIEKGLALEAPEGMYKTE